MTSKLSGSSTIPDKHWAEEILKTPKRDLVFIMTSYRDDIKEAVVDYSNGVFNRLSDVLENTKSKTLKILDETGDDFGVNLDHVIGMEIKSCHGRQIKIDPEKISDNKPVEVEIIMSNGIGIRGIVYLKLATDINKRVNSSNFLNVINIDEFSRVQHGGRQWSKTSYRTMSINTNHIGTIRKKRDLFKLAKVWVADTDSRIKGKKKQVEKIVPLDYVEETAESNLVIGSVYPE